MVFILSYLNYLREHYKRFFSFQVVAWSGTVVNLLLLWLMHGVLGIHLILAGALAIEITIIYNFTLYYYVTWGERRIKGPRHFFWQLVRFNAITAFIDFAVRLTILWFLTEKLSVHYILADMIGMTIAPLFKYYANEHIIFQKKKEQIAD
jgi:dolichol-phosphate mannosyltransferase